MAENQEKKRNAPESIEAINPKTDYVEEERNRRRLQAPDSIEEITPEEAGLGSGLLGGIGAIACLGFAKYIAAASFTAAPLLLAGACIAGTLYAANHFNKPRYRVQCQPI